MTPEWGSRSSDLPPETQFVLAQLRSLNNSAENSAPTFVCLVPLIDKGAFRATLRPPSSASSSSDSSDDLCLRIESGSPLVRASSFENALLVAAGTDPLALADAAVVAAASLSGAARPRTAKQIPDFVDLFGWCTWDAFYSSVSARGVSDGLQALKEAGAPPPGFLIIDDGWQVTCLDAGPLSENHHAATNPAEASRADAELGVLMQGAAGTVGGGESGLLGPMANAAAAEAVVEREVAEAAAEEGAGAGGRGEESNLHHRAALAHLPSAAAPAADGDFASKPSKAKTMAASASGWAKGKAELALASVYGKLVERAPAGSLGHRAFGALVANADPGAWREKTAAKKKGGEEEEEDEKEKKKKKKDGPLRPALLGFYASTSDHVRRLASFRANEKFSRPGAGPAEAMRPGPPDGLASVVQDVRERFGVRRVLAWHALHGYWGGVAPDGSGFFVQEDRDGDGSESRSEFKDSSKACNTALVWPVPTPGVLDVDPPYAWSPQCLSGVGLARDPAALFRGLHG
jgi:raffinose synthase